jgi:hypothetical protein
MDLGIVSQELMRALKHEKTVANKRLAFTGQEYSQLYLFIGAEPKRRRIPASPGIAPACGNMC